MFHIYKNNCRNLTSTQFSNTVPLLYNALCPSQHNLLYDLRIKRFGLRDKPHIHRDIQLLVRGKPTTS
jgi:DNA topoisomerase VI subunit B